MVMETRELRELLGPDVIISKSTKEKVLLRSDKYCQLACDLRELQVFKETLESLVSLDNADVLFVAEVSVTYMDTYSADSLIQWASGIGKAEFCLLEQILPNGPNHPFAKTMLKHFEKLNTPLKSVKQYPTISSQISRFNSRGWQQVDIWDLWEAWEGDDFITSAERIALDDIEPFDEWEELMLFGRHYFVMHAWATTPETPRQTASKETHNIPRLHVNVTPQPASRPVKRRFGNTTLLLNPEGHHYAAHILGLDRDSRSETYDLWSLGHSDATSCKLPLSGPTPRMCSTLTEMGEYGVLLAGGRGSPSKPLSDCWILKKGEGKWTKTWDLPTPLFRHSAVRLNGSSLVLVVGGKTGPSNVSIESFVCHPEKGWLKCEVSGQVPSVFGAVVCNSPQSTVASGEFQGLLCGGMLQDGTMNLKNYWWHLRMVRSQVRTLDVNGSADADADADDFLQPNLCFSEVEMAGPTEHQLSVFGAEIVDLGYCVAICGGTGSDPSYQGQHITLVSLSERPRVTSQAFPTQDTAAWPFMIGSSVLSNGNQLTILGGGATCFSMGTYWETMPYQLALPNDGSKPDIHPSVSTVCEYLGSPKIVGKVHEDTATTTEQVTVTTITRVRLTSGKTFESLLQADKPVIIEGLNLGTCLQKWTPEYMISAVGAEREIVVHEVPTDSENMDFNSKNFTYVTTSFANLFSRIQDGGRLYLRSLSQTKPSEAPANIQDDFSELSGDFVLPDEIGFVRENVHSSVLRVGGRVNMWLHYDVSFGKGLYFHTPLYPLFHKASFGSSLISTGHGKHLHSNPRNKTHDPLPPYRRNAPLLPPRRQLLQPRRLHHHLSRLHTPPRSNPHARRCPPPAILLAAHRHCVERSFCCGECVFQGSGGGICDWEGCLWESGLGGI